MCEIKMYFKYRGIDIGTSNRLFYRGLNNPKKDVIFYQSETTTGVHHES